MRHAARELAHRLHLLRLGGLHLQRPAVGGVHHVDEQARRNLRRLGGVARQGAHVDHRGEVARAVEAHLHRRDGEAGGGAGEHRGDLVAHRGLDDLAERQADQVVAGAPQHARQGLVGLRQHRVGQPRHVHHRNAHRRFVEHQAAERPGGVAARLRRGVGGVARHHGAGQGFAVLVVEGLHQQRGHRRAARAAQAHRAAPRAVHLGPRRTLGENGGERRAEQRVRRRAQPLGERQVDVAEVLRRIEGIDPDRQEIEEIAERLALRLEHVLHGAARRDVGSDEQARARRARQGAHLDAQPVAAAQALVPRRAGGNILRVVQPGLIGAAQAGERLALRLGVGEPRLERGERVGDAPEAPSLGIGDDGAARGIDDAHRPLVPRKKGVQRLGAGEQHLPHRGLAQHQKRAREAEARARHHRPRRNAAAARAAEDHSEAEHHDQRAPGAETLHHPPGDTAAGVAAPRSMSGRTPPVSAFSSASSRS